jgi:hypothetical protein
LSYLKHACLWQLQNSRPLQDLDDELTAGESAVSDRSAA